jgi:hypothetical protein
MDKPIEYFIGLDLGQSQDYTAIAVIEKERLLTGERDAGTREWKTETRWNLRHMDRPSLGTPYPAIVDRVKGLIARSPLMGNSELVVDATGVGAPVVDLLKRSQIGAPVRAVTITGGDAVNYSDGRYRVPKRDLVSNLAVLFQGKHLRIADGIPFADVLVQELLNFRAKINVRTGNDSYEAWREGVHDDLVLAVALACWRSRTRVVGGPRYEHLGV